MAGGTVRWEWSPGPEIIVEGIDRWVEEGRSRLSSELQSVGEQMRAYAQVSHPWTNRTGQAEAQLGSQVTESGDGWELMIYQGAPYGIWLEVKYGGRWGILPETLQQGYGLVLAAIARAFG